MPVPGGEITTTELWQQPVDVNEATKCSECQGPLALTTDEYDPTVLYKRVHSIDCSNNPELVEDSTIYMDITLPTESEKVITIQEAIAEIKKEAAE
jgi:hypothetical protein